jgi:DUF1009 family protein
MTAETIGLIAGDGRFPVLFAESAKKAGYRVVAVAHRNSTPVELADHVEAITWVKLGQLGHITEALKEGGATKAVMIGGVKKSRFFIDALPDAAGAKVLASLAIRNDDGILRAVARHFEEQGITVIDPTPFLSDRVAPEGLIGKHPPTDDEVKDIAYGFELARGIGRLDLGQTVVVKDRAALAVECLEGTDACIERGADLGKAGVVVVKTVKPNQDRRFDLPAVGPDTLDLMHKLKARVLAVEAGATLMMDMDLMALKANRSKMVLIGVKEG